MKDRKRSRRRALYLESAIDFRITDQDGATVSLEDARLICESGALQGWNTAFALLEAFHFDLEAVKRYYALKQRFLRTKSA